MEKQETKTAETIATAKDILESPDVIIEIDAPELGKGKKIRVKIPGSEQLDELEAADRGKADPATGWFARTPGRSVRWTVACTVGADGERLFTVDQAKEVGKKCGRLLDRIFTAAHSGPTFSDKEVEAEIKN